MKIRHIILAGVAYVALTASVYTLLMRGHNVALFDTAGTIADSERGLIIFTILLGLGVVIPVLIMTFAIAWHYREGNKKARYSPELAGNRIAETIWWTIPTIIIGIVGVVIWQSSHDLDPFKPLASSKPPITVQVVALEWRWLFLYPDEHVASLSYLKFPVGTPVNFHITADAPMNSFWIPQLSGQVYAMSGMSTQLHVMADRSGDYTGSSANLSGKGFAGMKFTASAISEADYRAWVTGLQKSSHTLDMTSYKALAAQSTDTAHQSYALTDSNLYNEIIDTYTQPAQGSNNMMNMEGM